MLKTVSSIPDYGSFQYQGADYQKTQTTWNTSHMKDIFYVGEKVPGLETVLCSTFVREGSKTVQKHVWFTLSTKVTPIKT